MNDDILQGKWAQLKGKVKQQWAELTDDDLDRISGKREEIVGLMQERYGWERARAETEFDDYLKGQDW
ncbi:MAG: CsbD family protein [Candidatus Promineofilum sp.]|nr:CsbD family protein [Promineifilum sp.]